MKCPECLERIHDSAEECPHCGMTLERLHSLYDTINPHVQDSIHDVAGILNHNSRKQLRQVIQTTMRQFVGINFAVSFISLKNAQTIETYSFWLLNKGEFNNAGSIQTGHEEGQGRVILVVDVENKQAALSYGYLLDDYIREKDNFKVLSMGHASLLEGNILHGCSSIITALKQHLITAIKRAKKGVRIK